MPQRPPLPLPRPPRGLDVPPEARPLPRFLLLLLLSSPLVILAGCGQALRSLPPSGLTACHPLTVFYNGFHSGLLLPWPDPDIAFLEALRDDPPAALPWLELGFGADAWTRLDGGCCTAARLAFSSDAGVLMLRHQDGRRPVPYEDEPIRLWSLTLDRRAWMRLVAHLRSCLPPGGAYPREPGETDWLARTTLRWSVLYNCHDWTAGCLMAAGLDLATPCFRTSGGFAGQIEAATAELAAAGIAVVGPPGDRPPPASP